MEILFGADPEFFVRRKDNNELVSAYGLIPGTKKEPFKVKNGAVQVDGMALEFNIEPAANEKQWRDNINAVMGQMQHMLGDEYIIDVSPVAHFGAELIAAQPKVARELGCDPDYNAYTGLPNNPPNVEAPFRTASGHIHIGWTKDMDPFDPEHFEACRMLTKQLDLMLAPLSNFWDKDKERRELYGALGAFRPKPFGVEYRVLSNAWLKHPDTIGIVYNAAMLATQQLLAGDQNYKRHTAANWFNHENPGQWMCAGTYFYNKYPHEPWFNNLNAMYVKQAGEYEAQKLVERKAKDAERRKERRLKDKLAKEAPAVLAGAGEPGVVIFDELGEFNNADVGFDIEIGLPAHAAPIGPEVAAGDVWNWARIAQPAQGLRPGQFLNAWDLARPAVVPGRPVHRPARGF